MKGQAYNILVEFQRTSSPFLFAHLILELGAQQIDRMTPDLDDESTERTLVSTIEGIREVYELRRKRLQSSVEKRS
jgi:hypothetical protein